METTPPPNRVKSYHFTSSVLTRHLERNNLSFLMVQDRRNESIFSPLYYQNQPNKKKIIHLISKKKDIDSSGRAGGWVGRGREGLR